MRIPRPARSAQPADAIPPHAIPAPRIPEPSAPLFGLPDNRGAYVPLNLPDEDPNLLTARAVDRAAAAPMVVRRATSRSRCRILDISREEFEFEATVGQNFAMLADQDDYGQVTR